MPVWLLSVQAAIIQATLTEVILQKYLIYVTQKARNQNQPT